MKIEIHARRRGKTTKAIELANKTGAYLVVMDRAAIQWIETESHIQPKRLPITFDELLREKLRGSWVRNIVIDDADVLLQHIVGALTIEGITLNKGD